MRNIRKIAQFSSAFLALGALLTACDDIPEADRLIPQPKPEVKRNVLIQEFTGQRCSNCPQGAAAVYSIIENNPGTVVAVSLHPEGTAYTRPVGGLDLTCSVATAYYGLYQPSGFPAAIINGAKPAVTNFTDWSGIVSSELEKETSVYLNITPAYDAATRELRVAYDVEFVDEVTAPLTINVWVVENGIIGSQYQSSGPTITDYVHNHVLRGSLTDDWGLPLGESFSMLTNPTGEVSMTLPEAWVAENCEVVAFVQNSSSKAVENVTEAKLFE